MRIDGKAYRCISTLYFALHCVHFAAMIVGSFLPYLDNQNLYQVCDSYWPLLALGFAGLAAGCFCAWRTIKRPHYCVASFLLGLAWNLIYYFMTAFHIAGAVIGAAIVGQYASEILGVGFDILSYGLLLILVDFAFVVYMFILMFFEQKSLKY